MATCNGPASTWRPVTLASVRHVTRVAALAAACVACRDDDYDDLPLEGLDAPAMAAPQPQEQVMPPRAREASAHEERPEVALIQGAAALGSEAPLDLQGEGVGGLDATEVPHDAARVVAVPRGHEPGEAPAEE